MQHDVRARRRDVSGISDQSWRRRALHPPLTDFPIAAYVFAAAFDVISTIGGPHRGWATQFWHAGTFVLVAGLAVCLLTMMSGFFDLVRFPDPRSAVTRTIVTHVAVTAGVFMIGSGDVAWRLSEYGSEPSTPLGVLVLTVVAATAVCVGAAFGGTLVFRHGVGSAVIATNFTASGPPIPGPAVPGPTAPGPTVPDRPALDPTASDPTASSPAAPSPGPPPPGRRLRADD
jgi:uncharacterized membrane protein